MEDLADHAKIGAQLGGQRRVRPDTVRRAPDQEQEFQRPHRAQVRHHEPHDVVVKSRIAPTRHLVARHRRVNVSSNPPSFSRRPGPCPGSGQCHRDDRQTDLPSPSAARSSRRARRPWSRPAAASSPDGSSSPADGAAAKTRRNASSKTSSLFRIERRRRLQESHDGFQGVFPSALAHGVSRTINALPLSRPGVATRTTRRLEQWPRRG